MSRPVTEGVLEWIDDLPAGIDRKTFVRDRKPGDVAAQAFERVPFIRLAPRADPRLHHSGGLWRPESLAEGRAVRLFERTPGLQRRASDLPLLEVDAG